MSDVSAIPQEVKKHVKGSRLLFIDGLKPEPHISHFGFAQALEAVNELLTGPAKAYFTGLGHNM
jgi:phosphoribosyl 1,2-cyclic phosphate phosphodiesterase